MVIDKYGSGDGQNNGDDCDDAIYCLIKIVVKIIFSLKSFKTYIYIQRKRLLLMKKLKFYLQFVFAICICNSIYFIN